MAVLGSGGKLELRREAATPCIITPEDINPGNGSFDVRCEGYWSGDYIFIHSPDGLPIFIDGVPQRWDGVAMYGLQSRLFIAENRDHIQPTNTNFYKQGAPTPSPANTRTYYRGDTNFEDDDALFYYQGEDADDNQTKELDGYICIDALGRLKLYASRCEGLACCGESSLSFEEGGLILDFDFFVISHVGSVEYQNAVGKCLDAIGEYLFSDIADDNPNFASICEDPPLYLRPVAGEAEFGNADIQPRGEFNQEAEPLWTVLCDVREWSLNLDAPSVDTTGVGEKFGNSVKSLVSGGGSVEFFIDRKCYKSGVDNGLYLMRLLLMTQMNGCKAKAKFYMIDREQNCGINCNDSLGGALWYETEILVVQNAVNLRPDELIAGTANFVTTGEIKLLSGQD